MKQSPDTHLAYDDLLRAIVDQSDLDSDQRAHLASCHHCRRQAEGLVSRYQQLGQMARKLAPKPSRPFRVPAQQTPRSRWHFKPAMALGILGVMIFAFSVLLPGLTDRSDAPPQMVAQSVEEEERLMAEIDALVDDAMPRAYQHVAVVSEPILSKDLIDWIVPSIDGDEDVIEPRA